VEARGQAMPLYQRQPVTAAFADIDAHNHGICVRRIGSAISPGGETRMATHFLTTDVGLVSEHFIVRMESQDGDKWDVEFQTGNETRLTQARETDVETFRLNASRLR
jgi:hypothetical protein